MMNRKENKYKEISSGMGVNPLADIARVLEDQFGLVRGVLSFGHSKTFE